LLPGEEEKRRNSTLPDPNRTNLMIPPGDLVNNASGDAGDQSHTRNSSTTSQASVGYSSQNSQPGEPGHSRQSSSGGESSHGRNLSQGSSDTGFFGSMEKKEKNKRLHEGRPDAEKVINELMEGVDIIDKSVQEDQDSSGLQLFVGPDGSVSFDKRSSRKNYEQVVFDGSRR